MEELSDFTSPVVEFKAINRKNKEYELTDNCTATDPIPLKINAVVGTNTKCSKETQTVSYQTLAKNVDERKLLSWLQKIYSRVEKELLKGSTPILQSHTKKLTSSDIKIKPYQKLSVPAPTNSQVHAIWLSLHTSNAPVLVVTTVAAHDDWCEHVDQYFKVFVPQRDCNANFVTYNEEKCVPIKACLRSLCTNPFNKNIFAGSTFDGDVYIWQYQHYPKHTKNTNTIEIKEIYHTTSSHGYAVALDWSSEFTLLTGHSNGYVVQRHQCEDIVKDTQFLITAPTDMCTPVEISTLVALNLSNFVVGAKDGSVFHCSTSGLSAGKRQLEVIFLRKHLFMSSSLLKPKFNGSQVVISCDLSGEVYMLDLRNSNDSTDVTSVTQIALPFTNTIACSPDGSIIYSPGDDGSLDCYRLCNGSRNTIKGALKGKGNFITSTDNGCWIITGFYENELQIFSVES